MKRFNWINNQIKEYDIKNLCQVGTGKGNTSMSLLSNNPDLILHEVAYYANDGSGQDSKERHKQLWLKRINPYKNRVVIYNGKSENISKTIKDGCFDCVFIDADHSYEMALLDIENWYPKVKKGGLLCGHDFGQPRFPGVRKAVEEYFGGNFEFNIKLDYMWWVEV